MTPIRSRATHSLLSFLYSPETRVYNLRLLLVADAVALGLTIYFIAAPYDSDFFQDSWTERWQNQLPMTLFAYILIFIHHTVVGESPLIIAPRALVINTVAIAVAAFAVYAIVLNPLDSQVYVRTVAGTQLSKHWLPPDHTLLTGNLHFMMENTLLSQPVPPDQVNDSSSAIKVFPTFTTLAGYEVRDCGWTEMELTNPGGVEYTCSCGWNELASMEIQAAIPDTGVPAGMAALDVTLIAWSTRRQYLGIDEILSPQVRAARNSAQSVYLGINTTMRASLGWIMRELKSNPPETVYIPQFMSLQSETTPGSDSVRRNSSLVIVNLQPPRIIRIEEEFSDASILSGITSVGGFWTFVDGVFALLFGANVLTPPLSALGVVHVFQRNQLVRNWNQDFPALRTEGGSPGSESAGVVAFLRERLVDLDAVATTPAETAANAQIKPPKVTLGDPEPGAAPVENDNLSVPLLRGQDGIPLSALGRS
ncbi:hypothetical protein B0H13DRAFT_2332438 [Mycena leptocephala]|nr:hypothetical protein B0H13DRAFT_2332438 [Mycena leptocephala]